MQDKKFDFHTKQKRNHLIFLSENLRVTLMILPIDTLVTMFFDIPKDL